MKGLILVGLFTAVMATDEGQHLYGRGFIRDAANREKFEYHEPRGTYGPPQYLNWVKRGAVTQVKDQGACGSCWAFGTAATLEGAFYIATGSLQSFSEQMFVSCSNPMYSGDHNYGCDGGDASTALEYVAKLGYSCFGYAYGYQTSTLGYNGDCVLERRIATRSNAPTMKEYCTTRHRKGPIAAGGATFNTTIYRIKETNAHFERALTELGPISIGVNANMHWFEYTGGIFNAGNCSSALADQDHNVVLVGYGTENGKDFWLVKNSWAQTWGENGYIRLEKGPNTCGILNSGIGVAVTPRT